MGKTVCYRSVKLAFDFGSFLGLRRLAYMVVALDDRLCTVRGGGADTLAFRRAVSLIGHSNVTVQLCTPLGNE